MSAGTNKRLALLEKKTADGTGDSFVWYALGMEYAGLGRIDEALAAFTSLRTKDPAYVAMYLMCGTMLLKAARIDEGRAWLSEGVTAARAKGDTHALGEIESALAGIDKPE